MRALISSLVPAPSTMIVFSFSTLTWRALAELVNRGLLEFKAEFFGDDLAAGQDGDILQHGLAAVAKAGGLDGDAGEGAAQFVDDQGRQRFAFNIFGDDDQLLARLDDLLENRQDFLNVGDFLVGDQDVGDRQGRLPSCRYR